MERATDWRRASPAAAHQTDIRRKRRWPVQRPKSTNATGTDPADTGEGQQVRKLTALLNREDVVNASP